VEDLIFDISNLIFLFIMWIILDKKRFYISWSLFVLFMFIFLFINYKKDSNDKKDSGS
jgi:hypothetical protein